MSWVDDNKGEGPWPFTEQLDKWGYLNNPRWTDEPGPPVNYTGREDEEPQVWDTGDQNSHSFAKNEFSKDHKPCGHWHKVSGLGPPLPPVVSGFEIYFELFSGSVSMPFITHSTDLLSSESFIPINAANFDGDVTWHFEVIGLNSNDFDVTLQVVDTNGNVCSTIILPSGTVGPTEYELYRFRSDLVTFIHNDEIQYGIKIIIPEGEYLGSYPPCNCVISVARIIVRQSNATKTSMQIPLFGSTYNYILNEWDNYPYDYPLGHALNGPHYPDIIDGEHKNTSLWKYNSAELSDISKVIFSPAARSMATDVSPEKEGIVFTSLDFQHFHYMLYSTTANDIERADATPAYWVNENQVHTDDISGLVYTPIPGSYIHWDRDTDPYPFDYNLTPDLSGLGPGTHRIAIGGELYIGLPPENHWHHWQTFFILTIPPGYYVDTFTLHVYSTLPNNMKWVVQYSLMPVASTDLTLSLYDATVGAIVSGSELVWVLNEGFSRKFAEFSPDLLINGHEYRLAIDMPADFSFASGCPTYAEIMDAQLLLNIDSIRHLTTWRRCLSQYIEGWDDWRIPNAWGDDHWGCSDGSICISPRLLMYYTEGSKLYFEVTAFSDESWVLGQEDYMRVFLEDLGLDGSSGAAGVDVDGSLLEWSEDIENKLLRKRTGELAFINDNEYGNRQPDACVLSIYFPSGFIVTKII